VPGGKAERPGTAQRLNGDPQRPDPGNAGEGRPPRRPFSFLPGLSVVSCRGNDRYSYREPGGRDGVFSAGWWQTRVS
jgi:hypothetical protein